MRTIRGQIERSEAELQAWPLSVRDVAWIQTIGGRKLNYLQPDPDSLDIDEIALALSRTGRFANHAKCFYSVAQHSCVVEELVADHGGNIFDRMVALLHDAPEAYTGDVPQPLKRILPGLKEIELVLWRAISRKFLGETVPDVLGMVKHCDAIALATEVRDLMGYAPVENWVERLPPADPVEIVPLSMEQSRLCFLDRFHKLETRLIAQRTSE